MRGVYFIDNRQMEIRWLVFKFIVENYKTIYIIIIIAKKIMTIINFESLIKYAIEEGYSMYIYSIFNYSRVISHKYIFFFIIIFYFIRRLSRENIIFSWYIVLCVNTSSCLGIQKVINMYITSFIVLFFFSILFFFLGNICYQFYLF